MNSHRQRLAARRRNQETGSQVNSEPVFLAVAKIRRPHGLRGEALVSVLSDFPERLKPGAPLYLGHHHKSVRIQSRRQHSEGLLLSFEGVSSREGLEALRNQFLFVKATDLPDLEEGEFYHHQIIGLEVWEEDGERVGLLIDILETGANDVYIVRSKEGKEILLPATSEVILAVDLDSKRIWARLIPGLRT